MTVILSTSWLDQSKPGQPSHRQPSAYYRYVPSHRVAVCGIIVYAIRVQCTQLRLTVLHILGTSTAAASSPAVLFVILLLALPADT
jgi:hypothetical protein